MYDLINQTSIIEMLVCIWYLVSYLSGIKYPLLHTVDLYIFTALAKCTAT